MMKKLRPLLKWTGGKYDEFSFFKKYIPTFERYIDPFFGGGGVFFALQPKHSALINDKSIDLINFYQQISKPAFKIELLRYADAWEELGTLTKFLWAYCKNHFIGFIVHDAERNPLFEELEQYLNSYLTAYSLFKEESFIENADLFKTTVLTSIIDKAKRIHIIMSKEHKSFSEIEMLAHFETGIRSGAYLFFRKLLNLHYQNQIQFSAARAAANWYFIREFCYASMFRFNAKGEFNIPYGGITYNNKKFREKIERIFTEDVALLFRQTIINNGDFESFLINSNPKADDFIFVDPPYDSEFSEYDQSAFTRKDQERLANFLIKTPAKWMVVIKETPFIRKLYTHSGIKIEIFDKKYTYNVRGRNQRGVRHLIMMNY